MTLGRKTSTERELAAILAKRERAEHAAAQAAEAFTKVEADTEARLTALALSDVSADAYAAGKAEVVAARQAAQAEVERTAAIFAALSAEADRLATVAAQEKIAAGEQEVARLEVEREKAATVLAEVSAKYDHAQDELERARLAVERAARFTAENAAQAEALAEQERGVIEWHSQHEPTHPERWPAHLRDAILADVERRKAEYQAAKARLAEASRENLARVGLDPQSAREMLGIGREWPRL